MKFNIVVCEACLVQALLIYLWYVFQGMMLVSPSVSPVSCVEFEAEVYLLFHTTYICKGFQTVVHVGNVCQTAKIISMNKVRKNPHPIIVE